MGLGIIKSVVSVYLLCVCVRIYGLNILEFILGPRLGKSISDSKSLKHDSPAKNLVESFGYPFESHEVISGSGYILNLHRIPHGIKRRLSSKTNKPVALFQHGLCAASDAYLFRNPHQDLPYILADAGYDVWLSNMRGNVYSRSHKSWDPDLELDYWDFSLHEVAYYDYPVIFDYILNLTKQENLYFLGHSIGSTTAFIFASLRPEYNKKIKLHLALAPLVHVNHSLTLQHKIMLFPGISISETARTNQIYNIFPRRWYLTRILQMFCNDRLPFHLLCRSVIFALVGTDYAQFNASYIPHFVNYFPAGTSIYIMEHTLQIYLTGKFAPYDSGNETVNLKKYNKVVPSPYNLSLVTHPVSLHYGSGDILVTEKDMEATEKELPNPVGKFKVPYENFNHMDFMWGVDTKKLLYDRLVIIMDKYR